MKADRNVNTISLESEDVQMMDEEINEAEQTNFNSIEERQEEIPGMVTSLLKLLCKALEYVKIFVSMKVVTFLNGDVTL